MIKVNNNFKGMPEVYLFTQISRILAAYKKKSESIPLIRMDIGDIPGPLPSVVAQAMRKSVDDLTMTETFKGYGPEQGYSFLRDIISEEDYKGRGIDISPEEIFISYGAKCDLGNLGDILSKDCKVAVMDPSYPAYIDDNIIDGRAGEKEGMKYKDITYLKSNFENNFCPEIPKKDINIIYLCSPNNPTGSVLDKGTLNKWVEYAKIHQSLIIFDSAYESYIRTEGLPKSIYEIEGAKEVAIEVRSFSKTGGFTGIRCGYTVVPKKIKGQYSNGEEVELHKLWSRRQTTKFNGASYISQRGAEALYTEKGKKEVKEMTDSFLLNAYQLRIMFVENGWKVTGGIDSPYVWAGNPYGWSSRQTFETILIECGVSTTPGSGFGEEGDGFIRLSGFNTLANTLEAKRRISKWLESIKEEKDPHGRI